ncbi:MAG: scaffold protein [Microviridae sp. ctjyu33]|nr:MAG: scaffold protein [Microviridae sp. ctjyu33]
MSLVQRLEVDFKNSPSLTRQEFKKECDINQIMKKFKKVMGVDYLSKFNSLTGGQFGDFSEVSDYQTALNVVKQSEAMFMALPAIVRKRFDNDTAKFLDFCHDPKNADEMVTLGLREKPVAVAKPVEAAKPPVPAAG